MQKKQPEKKQSCFLFQFLQKYLRKKLSFLSQTNANNWERTRNSILDLCIVYSYWIFLFKGVLRKTNNWDKVNKTSENIYNRETSPQRTVPSGWLCENLPHTVTSSSWLIPWVCGVKSSVCSKRLIQRCSRREAEITEESHARTCRETMGVVVCSHGDSARKVGTSNRGTCWVGTCGKGGEGLFQNLPSAILHAVQRLNFPSKHPWLC